MSIINPPKVAILVTDRDDEKAVTFYSTGPITQYFVDRVDADTYEYMDHLEEEVTALVEEFITHQEVSGITLTWHTITVSLAPTTELTELLGMRLKTIFLRRFDLNPYETEFHAVLNNAEGNAWLKANGQAA
ncbi:MAG TPA: hypothetical protein VGE30_01890 [Candidatus Saccharimonadales bacterium]